MICVLFSTAAVCRGQLRELSTDRPDTTESPYTVDAGRFQMEVEAVAWSTNGGERETTFGSINWKVGLDDKTDFQLITPAYTEIRNGREGMGDMQIRIKRNLWGNDEGNSALAVMPYVQLPTSDEGVGSDVVEAGIIVPFAMEWGGGWSMGAQGQLDLVSDEEEEYLWQAMISVTASHAITEKSSAFFELVGILRPEDDVDQEYYFNTGVTYRMGEMLQLDGGIRIGLSDESTDYTPFVGISRKW